MLSQHQQRPRRDRHTISLFRLYEHPWYCPGKPGPSLSLAGPGERNLRQVHACPLPSALWMMCSIQLRQVSRRHGWWWQSTPVVGWCWRQEQRLGWDTRRCQFFAKGQSNITRQGAVDRYTAAARAPSTADGISRPLLGLTPAWRAVIPTQRGRVSLHLAPVTWGPRSGEGRPGFATSHSVCSRHEMLSWL